ncbi:MAG: phosphotransferase [Alphaproteobacteria bacterium]|nr:phosphotransferase [Alphaproteobacteria bacterium]
MPVFRDDPAQRLDRAIDPDHPELDGQLLDLARALCPAWAEAEGAELAVIGGGITNRLFRLRAPGRPPLLVRVYGPNTELVIDREGENRLLARLSREGFGPTYHGRFRNGRIEGYWEGFRPLEPQEMGQPGLREGIARRLAALHNFPPGDPQPRLWQTLGAWMQTARQLDFEGADRRRHAALALDRYAEALVQLEARFHRGLAAHPGAQAGVRAVLAHNDLLSGNILLHEASGELRFVDYEYGATSYAAFDVANHFCEYAGFDSDFARGFPDRAAREAFAAAYLDAPAGSDAVRAFSDVVEFFVLPDHLWWATWAVIQARYSPIDFDYLEYARLRLAGFEWHLGEFG